MTLSTFTPNFMLDWHSLIDEDKLNFFIDTGYLLLDECFDTATLHALQQESGFVHYKEATLTQGERLAHIRGDGIRWIDDDCPVGLGYLQSIEALGVFFNQMLFTGIRRAEAHYACYPAGFGYQWHSDNPVGRDERVISAVYYLNDDWGADDGGEISLIDKTGIQQKLTPKANRLVIFDSNLRHQVEITNRVRYSIATWLRRDDGVFKN